MSHTLLPPPETEQEHAQRQADIAELDEQMRWTEQLIHRMRERLSRAAIRHANYSLERSKLITRIAEPRHLTAEPSAWADWKDMPAHWNDFASNAEEGVQNKPIERSYMPTTQLRSDSSEEAA